MLGFFFPVGNSFSLQRKGTANGTAGFWNTDFEWMNGDDRGYAGAQCGGSSGTTNNWATCGQINQTDLTPVYAYSGLSNKGTIHSPASFYTWFHDTSYTISIPFSLNLNLNSAGLYYYSNFSFFPIDGMGWGDSAQASGVWHNFAFCLEAHTRFGYQGNEVFQFLGDDDVLVYINSIQSFIFFSCSSTSLKHCRLPRDRSWRSARF